MTVFGDLENLAQSLEWEEQADNSGWLLSGYRSWNGALFMNCCQGDTDILNSSVLQVLGKAGILLRVRGSVHPVLLLILVEEMMTWLHCFL